MSASSGIVSVDKKPGIFAGQRNYHGILAKVVTGVTIIYCLYHLLFILAVFDQFKLYMLLETHAAASLGLIMAITFIVVPGTQKRKNSLPWYDGVLAIVSLIGWGYIVVNYERVIIARGPLSATTFEIILGCITILLVLEATRRVAGWALTALASFFIFHALFGDIFPGMFYTRPFSLQMFVGGTYLYPTGILGTPMAVAATLVVAFLIFAQFLDESGAGRFFIDLALAIFGHVRGGPAKVAVIASCLFGTISGSPSGNVASTGVITIPLMKSIGYRPSFAGAVESVASTGGLIMPPVMGAVAFVMCEFVGITYAKLIIIALVPALLYYLAIFMMVDFEAARTDLKGIPRSELPSVRHVLKEGWHFLLPLGLLLVFLLGLQYSPTRSAIYALFSLFVVSLLKKETRMGPASIIHALEGGARAMPVVAMACATAGIVIGSLTMTGLGVTFAIMIKEVAGNNLLLLLLMAAVASYILGMGLPSIPIYIVVGTVIAPTLVEFGVVRVAAHLFVFYWAMVSFFTPPVAIATYVASGIARTSPWGIGLQSMRLGAASYILPFMFVYNPSLLLIGSPIEVIQCVTTATMGIAGMASALIGYLLRKLLWWERALLLAGAILLTMPNWQADLLGLALVLFAVVRQFVVVMREQHEDSGVISTFRN